MLRWFSRHRKPGLLSFSILLAAALFGFVPSISVAGERELNLAKQYFLDAAQSLENQLENDEAILERLHSQLVMIHLSQRETQSLVEWGLANTEVQLVSQAWYRVEVQKEKRAAASYDFTDCSNFGFRMLNNETRGLVRIRHEDRILFIGSGPLPSITHLAGATDHKITLCDRDLEAINISRHLIERHGITEHFGFIHSDANNIHSFSDYNLIWIAAMVPNKNSLMKEIAKTALPGTKVILRQAIGSMQLFILPREEMGDAHDFKLKSTIRTGSCESSLLMFGANRSTIWQRVIASLR